MTTQTQHTYTCRCGKKHPILKVDTFRKCGCGRGHYQVAVTPAADNNWASEKLIIKDKS